MADKLNLTPANRKVLLEIATGDLTFSPDNPEVFNSKTAFLGDGLLGQLRTILLSTSQTRSRDLTAFLDPILNSDAPIDLSGITEEEFQKLEKAVRVKDVFFTLNKDGAFGAILQDVIKQTYKNAFEKIMQESAEVAIREASMKFLREAFIGVASGSKKTTIEEIIKDQLHKGGGQGDGTGKIEYP